MIIGTTIVKIGLYVVMHNNHVSFITFVLEIVLQHSTKGFDDT